MAEDKGFGARMKASGQGKGRVQRVRLKGF